MWRAYRGRRPASWRHAAGLWHRDPLGARAPARTEVELELHPLGDALEYLPGEYVLLEDDRHDVPPRSYSVANAPRPDGAISLLVTCVPDGETSRWVHDRLRAGETVRITGPYGTFVDDPTASGRALYLTAGSGSPRSARCSKPSLRPAPAAR